MTICNKQYIKLYSLLKLIWNLQYNIKDLRKLINILESLDLSKLSSNYSLLVTSEIIIKSW